MTSLLERARTDLGAPWHLLRRRRDLRLLVGAALVSLSGDWILAIGLTYSVYAITGSTLASAITLLSGFVPQVLAGTVAGVMVDRWDRRRTMVGAHLLLAVGLVPLLLVDGAGSVWIVYPVLVWESVVEVFFAPAEQAMLGRVVDDGDSGELVTANALNAQAGNLARLVGGALGGVVAGFGGIRAVALVDMVTFLVAGALVLAMRGERVGADQPVEASGSVEPADQVEVVAGRLAQLRREWVEGWQVTWRSRPLRVLLVFSVVTAAGEGVMGTLWAPFVRSVLHAGPQALGVVSGVQAVGGILGALVAGTVGARWSPATMLGRGAVVFGLVDLAIFLYPLALVRVWPAVVGMVVVGVPGAVAVAGLMTLVQQHSTDAQRGRVFALVLVARSAAMVVGSTAAGVLGDRVGIVPVLAYQGVGYVAGGAMVLALLRGRDEGRGGPSGRGGRDGLGSPNQGKPLPPWSLTCRSCRSPSAGPRASARPVPTWSPLPTRRSPA